MALQSSHDSIPDGSFSPESQTGDVNAQQFFLQSILSRVQTVTLVEIVSCTNSGGLSPVGFVDVRPLVHQMDGAGNAMPHTTVFHIPYFRLQGGANAVIIDPNVGDIGICVFASRDISKVKNTKKAALPGSHRTFSYSDGLYLGGVLNGTPSQFIRFSASGIETVTPGTHKITAGGGVIVESDMTVTGDLISKNVRLSDHTHGGVVSGGSNTSIPNEI